MKSSRFTWETKIFLLCFVFLAAGFASLLYDKIMVSAVIFLGAIVSGFIFYGIKNAGRKNERL